MVICPRCASYDLGSVRGVGFFPPESHRCYQRGCVLRLKQVRTSAIRRRMTKMRERHSETVRQSKIHEGKVSKYWEVFSTCGGVFPPGMKLQSSAIGRCRSAVDDLDDIYDLYDLYVRGVLFLIATLPVDIVLRDTNLG